jgi:hypothetical protein
MIFRREPALIIGAVQSVIALAVAFGFELSNEQTGALLAVTAAVLAVVTRQNVYAPATVERIEAATTTPIEDDGGG